VRERRGEKSKTVGGGSRTNKRARRKSGFFAFKRGTHQRALKKKNRRERGKKGNHVVREIAWQDGLAAGRNGSVPKGVSGGGEKVLTPVRTRSMIQPKCS